ncbi:tonB-system energizer ExbB [Aureimonas mangrovi]|uniref:tonB-system energizer ExbB n=1 Tax=Aureimonas mangrovi TaxID=2758041 RepID=UPI00163DDC07|nr:tonB-system energizer ExbB [Aureimonas mangrovi]
MTTRKKARFLLPALFGTLLAATPGHSQETQQPAPTEQSAPSSPVTPPAVETPATTQDTPPPPAEEAPAAPAAGDPAPAAPASSPSVTPAPAGQTTPPATAVDEPATSGQPGPVTAPAPPPSSAQPGPADTAAAERSDQIPHDLTPLGMFMAADWVVKGVMIGLALASLVTWTIWLAKALELAFARRRARAGVRRLERAATLHKAIDESGRRWRGPVAALALAAQEERALSGAALSAEGVKERAAIALSRIEARAGRSMSRGTGILATIGSTAPFIGLFGTVWGIMNSFISISESNTTNLAVVAPGIAEALLATGIGLVAAIPAVIIYNAFSRSIAGYRAILADGSAAVMRHLSRDLDRDEAHPHVAASAPRVAPAE